MCMQLQILDFHCSFYFLQCESAWKEDNQEFEEIVNEDVSMESLVYESQTQTNWEDTIFGALGMFWLCVSFTNKIACCILQEQELEQCINLWHNNGMP